LEFVMGVVVGAALASVGALGVMTVRMASSQAAPAQERPALWAPAVVTLSGEGKIFVGTKEVSRDELIPELRTAIERAGSHHVSVNIDRALSRDQALPLLAAMRRAGALAMSLSVN
jgi:biopolymer transport protein ExbD